jgi:hypothetical protein
MHQRHVTALRRGRLNGAEMKMAQSRRRNTEVTPIRFAVFLIHRISSQVFACLHISYI